MFRCWSRIGRVGGGQPLSLGSGCEYVGVIMHELMHSIGKYNLYCGDPSGSSNGLTHSRQSGTLIETAKYDI